MIALPKMANRGSEERIAIFVGSKAPFNVQRDAENFGWMLSDDFELDLITTTPETFETETLRFFDVHGETHPSTAFGQLKALHDYLSSSNPDLIMHLSRPSLHGNLVGTASYVHDSPFLLRYSGDTFGYCYNLRGIKKFGCFVLRNILGRIPLKIASHFMVLGPLGQSRLVARGVNEECIRILPTTIHLDSFSTTSTWPDELPEYNNRNIVLFVGRRTHMKGIETLERTIPKILNRRSDLQFVFVGGGPKVPDVGDHQGHIDVVGSVPPTRLPEFYEAASCVVLPSLSEGLPHVLLESLAMETPVVARDVGDISTVTQNTFQTEKQFIGKVANFETLPVDDISNFTRRAQKDRCIEVFSQFLGNCEDE